MKAAKPEVAIVMGSDSDWPDIKSAADILEKFGVRYEARVISAHRTPDIAATFAKTAGERGIKIIIAAAGGAAHLAGVLAGHTVLPVIGIPVKSGAVNGVDALLSTLQMPAGIPVATVTLGSAGPVNAAILAVQILAIGRKDLSAKLAQYKQQLRQKVADGDARIQAEIKKK